LPELPDVQVYKEYLDATSLHHRVKSVEVRSAMVLAGLSARELKREVRGRVFERTRRHGKHLFVALDAGAGSPSISA
jgi:formamidopyrimidine-DNA glycosylase